MGCTGKAHLAFSERNGGISAASNQTLKLAFGEFVGLLDHDGELVPDALFEVAKVLQHILTAT